MARRTETSTNTYTRRTPAAHRTPPRSGGAHRGYTQSDTAAYDPAAAERHWRELLARFARAL
ncbi:hypothetical protein ACFU8W_26605 [Streptomyces sp. NPDC057565]|uniref:hypothetical protein n=1 Tax=Streptomyces sp. NPDC057565 TaxID=3346169 RepID=UPI003693E0BD